MYTLTVILMYGIVGYGPGPNPGRGLSGFVVNTDENLSFKISDWVLLSPYVWPYFFRGIIQHYHCVLI